MDFKEELKKKYDAYAQSQKERGRIFRGEISKAIMRELTERASNGESYIEGQAYEHYFLIVKEFCETEGLALWFEKIVEEPVRAEASFKYKVWGWAE